MVFFFLCTHKNITNTLFFFFFALKKYRLLINSIKIKGFAYYFFEYFNDFHCKPTVVIGILINSLVFIIILLSFSKTVKKTNRYNNYFRKNKVLVVLSNDLHFFKSVYDTSLFIFENMFFTFIKFNILFNFFFFILCFNFLSLLSNFHCCRSMKPKKQQKINYFQIKILKDENILIFLKK